MVTVEKTDLRHEIVEMVDERLEQGDSLGDAGQNVLKRIIKERRLGAQLLREFGARLIMDVWRHHNASERNRAASPPGQRRVDPQALVDDENSMLDSLVNVGGKWIPRGDVDAKGARELQKFHHGQAAGNLREAYMYSKCADQMKGGDTIRSRFTDEQLRGFLQEFRLE